MALYNLYESGLMVSNDLTPFVAMEIIVFNLAAAFAENSAILAPVRIGQMIIQRSTLAPMPTGSTRPGSARSGRRASRQSPPGTPHSVPR